jgi:hypothetical protein
LSKPQQLKDRHNLRNSTESLFTLMPNTALKYVHYPTALRAELCVPPGDGEFERQLLTQLQGDTSEEVFRLLNSV